MNLLPQHQPAASCSVALRNPARHRGVALVITLILLAVITTLAIAFLGITHRETGAVDSMARTTDAEMATDSALERAKAEIAAVYPGHNLNAAVTNTLGPDMMVSICCQNYDATPAVRKTIPYDRLNPDQRITNRYDAAPPVFVDTNRPGFVGTRGPLDDRFFVDLNRNGIFEDSGNVPVTDNRYNQVGNLTNWAVGDPQWVGLLQNPRQAHGPNNRYIARYAYMVLPAGRSLDVNWIHNDALESRPAGEGYYRNQGVGPWELNMAGFLADLNANEWSNPLNPPLYRFTNSPPGGSGLAFQDAKELLDYRYAGSRANRNSLDDFFPGMSGVFSYNQIDMFADGFATPIAGLRQWSGAASPANFFSVHDYFDPVKLPKPIGGPDQFRDRLQKASNRGNSYDRYTFYRMLAQMGTDSIPEEDGKINVNYVNVPSWKTGERLLASDLIRWSTNTTVVNVPRLQKDVDMGRPIPEIFFLTVATNLLAREPDFAFMVTNRNFGSIFTIPIFTNGSTATTNLPMAGPLYSARVHQIFQLAANILDATTGPKGTEDRIFPYFPSVFRPWFMESNGNVFITNYTMIPETQSAISFQTNYLWRDLESREGIQRVDDLVYGIPLIVGARKGYPNFNELAVVSVAEATRKLKVYRSTPGKDWDKLEQQFSLNLKTMIQIEARNSYSFPNQRPLELVVGMRVGVQVKERTNAAPILNTNWVTGVRYTYAPLRWPGEPLGSQQTNSYAVSPVFQTNLLDWLVITNADGDLPTNGWTASLMNRMLFYLVDNSVAGGRIVDAVSLNRPTNYFEIGKLMEEDLPGAPGALSRIWSSAKAGKVNVGTRTQLDISGNSGLVGDGVWGSYDKLTAPSKEAAAAHFAAFMSDTTLLETNQAPFTPTRVMVQANYYQVDDPLVHYTFEDLRNDKVKEVYGTEPLTAVRTNLSVSIGVRNPLSYGWNKGEFGDDASIPGQGTLDPTVRDPGMIHPDFWDFPTSFFPSVGWLGRVHRGTPWQTIYLKSRAPNQDWVNHSGNQRATHPYAANLMQPRRDWELLDIFTTAPHPNATRGRLSINQTNLAAWSAVLSGVLTSETVEDPNNAGLNIANTVVMNPAAISPVAPSIETIVTNINKFRTLYNSNQFNPYGQFTHLSQMLSAPLLTDDSPFLNVDKNRFDARQPNGVGQIYDADYERIPQQILSLLKVGEPRFVIYGWGQSLKPARLGVQYDGSGRIDPTKPLSGPSIDPGTKTVNNYQVTGEVATRSVVRVVFPERESNNPLDPGYYRPDHRRPRLVVESFNVIPVE